MRDAPLIPFNEEHPDWEKAMSLPSPLTKEQAQILVREFGLASYTYFVMPGVMAAVKALIAIAEQ